jgi:hypothetical protein
MCSISEITDDNPRCTTMPVLENVRHETFAQQLVMAQKFGWTRGAAYSRAGYKAEGHAAEANAHRLLKNAENGIAARVQEIVGAGAKRAAVTVESLLGELDMVLAGAVDDRQFGAARAAIDSKARLKGLFVDKVEVGGPGSLGMDVTIEEMINEFGNGDPGLALVSFEAAVVDLRADLEARAAAYATIIGPPPSSVFRPVSETTLALELLRPNRRGDR